MLRTVEQPASSLHTAWYERSVLLCIKLRLYETQSHISAPLARYIEGSHMALPAKTIVLVERPYRTNILPFVASAMSYDVIKNPDPTPSTAVLATDMKNILDTDWVEIESWFRDSWMHIKSGVFLINVCCFEAFMENSLYERVSVCEFVRDMIEVSYTMSREVIELVALGNPAVSCADRIRNSIPERSKKVKVSRGPNPAGLRHRFGDLASPTLTLGKKPVTKALYKAVTRSQQYAITTLEEYCNMSSSKSSVGDDGKNFIADLERVEQFFKSGGKYQGPVSDEDVFKSLRISAKKFIDTLTNERVTAALVDWRETGNSAKGAYKSSNRGYEPKSYNKGASSEKSSTQSPRPFTATPSKGKFAEDDEAVPVNVDDQASSSTVPMDTPASTPTVEQMRTPTKQGGGPAPAPSNYSARSSSKGVKMMFLEDIGEDEVPTEGSVLDDPALSSRDDTTTNVTKDEFKVVELVDDFIRTSNEYNISPMFMEDVAEFTRTRRAANSNSVELLHSVREVVKNSKWNVESDLGFVDGKLNSSNPVVQLILKHAD